MDLVKNMFEDKTKCVAEGQVLAAAMLSRTDSLADGLQVLVETDKWRVLFVSQSAVCRPVDLMHYQKRIDERIDGKPTLVLTQDIQALSSGLFNLGLRRAGDNINMSEVATKMKLQPEIRSGGGHAFAGGVQSQHSLPTERIKEMAIDVMNQLFPNTESSQL